MSKYSICRDCYFNSREPTICEDCSNGSEYEPAIGDSAELTAGSGSKKVKTIKIKVKDSA